MELKLKEGGREGLQSTGGEHFGDNTRAELHMPCSHTLRDGDCAHTHLKSSWCIFRIARTTQKAAIKPGTLRAREIQWV